MHQNKDPRFLKILHAITVRRLSEIHTALLMHERATSISARHTFNRGGPPQPQQVEQAEKMLESAALNVAKIYEDAHSRYHLIDEFEQEYPG